MAIARPEFNYHSNLSKWIGTNKSTDFLPKRYAPSIADETILTAPRELSEKLAALVGDLSLLDVQILSPGRTSPPRNQADFGLTALLGQGAIHHEHDGSEKLVFGDLSVNPPARSEYTDYNAVLESYDEPDVPVMDGQIGVGLTYQNRLVALCLGIASTDGPLITQLQDVSSKWKHKAGKPTKEGVYPGLPTGKYESGLHSGIDWKQTLVRTWQQVVPAILHEVGSYSEVLPALVQSGLNNEWLRLVDREFIRQPLPENRQEFIALIHQKLAQFERVYDLTAIALGGEPDPRTKNYTLPLQLLAMTRRENGGDE